MPDDLKPPAGWYAHPEMANSLRYWDGDKWGEQVAPVGPAPAKSQTWSTAWGVAIGVLIAVLVVFMIVQFATADDDLNCATENADRAIEGLPAKTC